MSDAITQGVGAYDGDPEDAFDAFDANDGRGPADLDSQRVADEEAMLYAERVEKWNDAVSSGYVATDSAKFDPDQDEF